MLREGRQMLWWKVPSRNGRDAARLAPEKLGNRALLLVVCEVDLSDLIYQIACEWKILRRREKKNSPFPKFSKGPIEIDRLLEPKNMGPIKVNDDFFSPIGERHGKIQNMIDHLSYN